MIYRTLIATALAGALALAWRDADTSEIKIEPIKTEIPQPHGGPYKEALSL